MCSDVFFNAFGPRQHQTKGLRSMRISWFPIFEGFWSWAAAEKGTENMKAIFVCPSFSMLPGLGGGKQRALGT